MFRTLDGRRAADRLLSAVWAVLLFLLVLGMAALFGALTDPARAQETVASATTFDFAPFLDTLLDILAPTIAGVASMLGLWCLERLGKWLGLKIDERRAQTVSDGLQHATAFGLDQARLKLSQGLPVDLRKEAITSAATYAQRRFPDALRHFGVTPISLAEMVEARLATMLEQPAAPALSAPARSEGARRDVADLQQSIRSALREPEA